MAIDKSGNGLDILILSDSDSHSVWLTFSTWYSLFKNIPHSNIVIGTSRNFKNAAAIEPFKWVEKVHVPYFQFKNLNDDIKNKFLGIKIAKERNLIGDKFLLLSNRTYALSCIKKDVLDLFSMVYKNYIKAYDSYYFDNADDDLLYDALNNNESVIYKNFCDKCDESTNPLFGYLHNKCGKFDLAKWIERYETHPFDYTQKFKNDNLTNSEVKILNLWKQLSRYYGTLK